MVKSVILVNEHYHDTKPTSIIALDKLSGITLLERHLRTLKNCGVQTTIIIPPPNAPENARTISDQIADPKERVRVVDQKNTISEFNEDDTVLLVAGHYYIEKPLIDHIIKFSNPSLLIDSTTPNCDDKAFSSNVPNAPVGCALISYKTLQALLKNDHLRWQDLLPHLTLDENTQQLDIEEIPSYKHNIRRHRRSMWMQINRKSDCGIAHSLVIDSAQKGSLDLPAQLLHAPIENYIVSKLCNTSATPNQITLITNIAAWTVTWGILSGYLWLSLIGAAFVGIMDGLDGKLARAKIKTSKVGELEHIFDMMFEYSWWLSLGWVLGGGNIDSPTFMAGVALVLLNFTDSITGVGFWFLLGKTHTRILDNYTPLDLAVRKVSGRRNIYIWLLLLTGPMWGLTIALWVCVWWGIATIIVRGGRALWLIGSQQAPQKFRF